MPSPKASSPGPRPSSVYQESDAVTRALRDYLSDDIGEILVDDAAAFQKAQEYMQRFMPPEAQRRLKFYQEDVPLFTRFQIENQIESAYAHKVQLPSGGSIVIDYTEALVSIDINSARATRGGDIETTASNTNLEAADEIARQLRIRDAGGLIVIDFIDMESPKNQREVEDRLRDAVKQDRARIQIGTPVALRPAGDVTPAAASSRWANPATSLARAARRLGNIRSVESMALAILRLAGEDARKERTARLIVQVPVKVATYLMNEKRGAARIEEKCGVELVLVPNQNIETPEFYIRRVRNDELGLARKTRRPPTRCPRRRRRRDVGLQAKRPPAPQAAVTTIVPHCPGSIGAATDIFITPGYRFRAIDMLFTNFHLPRSTLFMLVSAFTGMETMKAAYAHAIQTGYRFYSMAMPAYFQEPGRIGSRTSTRSSGRCAVSPA